MRGGGLRILGWLAPAEFQAQEVFPVLIAAIAFCETAKDYVSRELFEHILEATEKHIDWLETQLDVMQKVGIQNWLQSQM